MYSLYHQHLGPGATLAECVRLERNLLEKILSRRPVHYLSEALNYSILAEKHELYLISPHATCPTLNEKHYERTYRLSLGSETATSSEIRNKILSSATSEVCPYCGTNKATEIDHFLPKEYFFKFSVLSCNLVPSCHSCNHTKGFKYGHSYETQFFHPYFDKIFNTDWARCEVSFKGRLSVNYLPDPELPVPIIKRLENYLLGVGVQTTWRSKAATFLSGNRERFRSILIFKDEEELQKQVNKMLEDAKEEEVGINNWKRSLLNSLLKNDEFFTIRGIETIPGMVRY